MTTSDESTIVTFNDKTRAQEFTLALDGQARAALAESLDIPGIKKLTFSGTLAPSGSRDWQLDGTLGATVVQPCVVTLEPVTTRIDEPVTRRYLAEVPDLPEAAEVEMPDDDTVEPLPRTLDLSEVMAEALSLALPPWPRAEGVDAGDIAVTEPGKAPMTDDDAKPFAGLKDLRDKLGKDGT